MGVDVVEGILREGTPICIPSKNKILLGKVENIQINKESIKTARRKDGSVAIRINTDNFCFGRHFTEEDELVSLMTRKSIDKLKEHYRDEMLKSDWNLVRKLKKTFNIS